MNTAKTIFKNLQTIGAQISVVGNTLRLEADQGTISNDMKENIKKHKSEIISLVKQKHSCEKSEESEERGVQTSKEGLISLNSLSSQEIKTITITATNTLFLIIFLKFNYIISILPIWYF